MRGPAAPARVGTHLRVLPARNTVCSNCTATVNHSLPEDWGSHAIILIRLKVFTVEGVLMISSVGEVKVLRISAI